MHRRGPGLLLVLAALLWLPSAAAESSTQNVTIWLATDRMSLVVAEAVTGLDASNLRREIDEDYGNGDGNATLPELRKFEAANRFVNTEETPECFEDFELVQINGAPPRLMSEFRIAASGATGPVENINLIYLISALDFRFTNVTPPTAVASVHLDGFYVFGQWPLCVFDAVGAPTQYDYAPTYWSGGRAWEEWGSGPADDFVLSVLPLAGARLVEESIVPAEAAEDWNGTGLRADSEAEVENLWDTPFDVRVDVFHGNYEILGGTIADLGPVVGVSLGLGSGVILLGVALMAEHGRFLLLNWLFAIPGFSRFDKDEVLEHDRRNDLYGLIQANPGASFSDLRRVTEMANGTLVHHLRILEAQEYVKIVRDGFRTRFYVRGPKVTPEPYLTRTARNILDTISANPGITQKELSAVVGLPRESVSYHAKRLSTQGKLRVEAEGKWRRYFPAAPPSALPRPSGQSQ